LNGRASKTGLSGLQLNGNARYEGAGQQKECSDPRGDVEPLRRGFVSKEGGSSHLGEKKKKKGRLEEEKWGKKWKTRGGDQRGRWQ